MDGEVIAHRGNSEDNLELLLASVSDEDVIEHQPERLVLKTVDKNFYLLSGGIDKSYQGDDLELSNDDRNYLYNDWQIDGQKASTTWTVREDVTYRFPLNEQMQLHFNHLPSETSTLTIEEVSLSTDLQASLGALSSVAYDVRTEMEDGEFNYDLYLPKSETEEEVVVKFAENLAELEQEAQLVEGDISVDDEQVKVANLDHMTVFVVVPADIVSSSFWQFWQQGWRMTRFGNAAIDLVAVADHDVSQQFGPHSIRLARTGGTGTNRSYLAYYQSGLRVASLEEVAWSQYSKTGNDFYLNIFIRQNVFPWKTATIVYHPTTPIGQWTHHVLNADTTNDNLHVRHGGAVFSMSFAEIQNDYVNWHIDNHMDSMTMLGGIVFVSGSSSPQAPQEHFIDNVHIKFLGQEAENFDFVQYVPVVSRPEQIGYNVNDDSPISQTQTRYACSGGFTNINGASVHWTDVRNNDPNIKYQRQFSRDGINWSGNEIYINTHTNYRSFGYGEVEHYSQVRSFYDSNNNGQYDVGEPASDWSKVCSITYDATSPNLGITYQGGVLVDGKLRVQSIDDLTYIGTYTDGNSGLNRTSFVIWTVDPDTLQPIVYPGNNTAHLCNWNGSAANISPLNGTNSDSLINVSLSSCTSHAPAGWSYPEGTYRIGHVVYDNAGNQKSFGNSYFMIDSTPPSGSIDHLYYLSGNTSKDYFVTNDNKPVFEGACSDNDGLREVTLEVDGQAQTINCKADNTWRSAPLSSSLTDGDYTVSLTLTDLAGNVTTKTQELEIDTVIPTAAHTYYVNGQEVLGSMAYIQSLDQLTFTANYEDQVPSSGLNRDVPVIFSTPDFPRAYCGWSQFLSPTGGVVLGGSNSESLVNPWALTSCTPSLAEGEYFVRHRIYDNSTRSTAPNYNQHRQYTGTSFIVDTTFPISTITFPENDGILSTIYLNDWNGLVVGTAVDPEEEGKPASGVEYVKIVIQKNGDQYWNSQASQWQDEIFYNSANSENNFVDWTFQLDSLEDGSYRITSHATDRAGNTEESYTVTIILDKTIPQVDLTVNPTVPDGSGNWYITRPEVTLTANDNFELNYIQYRWGITGSWNTYSNPLQSPAEGTNTLYYKAFDKAGNESEEGIKTLQWDQTELAESPLNVEANPNPTAESSSTISWDHASDNVGINKYKIAWDLRDGDDKHSKEVNGDVSETEIDELKEGSYKITVTAYDGSGYNKSASTNLTVDRTAPAAPVLTLLAQRPGEIDLAWEAVADASRYIIYYGLEAGSYLYAADVGNVTDYTVTGLTAGNYYFVVRAVDESDNQSANSNEVSILDFVGAPAGTLVAEGFAEAGEVQGETTEASEEEQATMFEEIERQGEVKGAAITCTNFSKSLFWIFLALQALIMLLLAKFSKQFWLKLLAFLVLPAVFTLIIMRTGLANCFTNGTMIWLSNNYYLPAYLTAIFTELIGLFFITD